MSIPESLSGEVLRAALLSLLTLCKKPVILLVAPGGYGKTVAVAQWMRTQKDPCVWVTERALSTTGERLLQEICRQLRGLQKLPPVDSRVTLEDVLLLLDRQRDVPVKLVFDGLDGASRETMLLLARLCRGMPAGHQVVLCCRSPRLEGFQQLFIKQQVEVFTAEHLAFSVQECTRVVGRPYTQREYERSRGWCQEVCHQHQSQFVYDPKAYIEELALELDEAVAPALPLLLQRDVWCESDFPQPETLWKLLESGVPLLPVDLLHYQLHPLLQEWLLDQHQGDADLPTGDLDLGVALQMVRRLVASDQLETLMPWLDRTVREWLRQDQFDAIVTVLETLDVQTLSPFLRTALAEAHLNLAHVDLSERMLLDQVQDGLPTSRTFANLALIALRRDRLDEAKSMLDQGKLVAMDAEDELWVTGLEVYHQLRISNVQRAVELADFCVTLARSTGLQEMLILSHCRMAYVERIRQNPRGVEYHTGEALRFALHQGLVHKAAIAVNALADQQKDLGLYQKALENITTAIGGMHSKHPYTGVMYGTRGLIFTEMGNFEEALRDLQESQRLLHLHHNHHAAMLPAAFITYCLYRLGHFEELNRHFQAFDDHVQLNPSPNNQDGRLDYHPLASCICHYANGKKREALQALEEVVVSERNSWLDSVLLAQLFRCKIKHELKEVHQKDADLLMRIIESRDTGVMVGMYYDEFSGVLDHFIERGWHARTLQELVQHRQPHFNPIQKIRIEMLGKPRLLIGDREVKIPNNYPAMALIYLHLHRGSFSTTLRMTDHLWREDLQERKARSNRASAACSMLKKVLRDFDATYEDLVIKDPREGLQLNEKFEVTSDLDPYLHPQNLGLDEQLELLQKLVELHRLPGMFFGTITTDWAESVREQIREAATDMARMLAEDRALRGDHLQALELLEMGLQIDPHAFELMEQAINYARTARQFERAADLGQRLSEVVGKDLSLRHQLVHHPVEVLGTFTLHQLLLGMDLRLQPDCNSGTLVSNELESAPFTSMILSWNGAAPAGSTLEVAVRVKIAGEWSGFYSYGQWSEANRASTPPRKDPHGHMDTDVLKLYSPATCYQYRVTFNRLEGAPSPALWQMTVLTTGEEPLPSSHTSDQTTWGTELQVPSMSQLTFEEGAGWCSPTCLKMVFGHHGVKVSVPELAQRVYDSTYRGTGNWVFNTAAAAAYGLRGYVHRLTGLPEAEHFIARGLPLVLSLSWKEGELTGAPLTRSTGHLILLVGFTREGHPIVHDPAALRIEDVRRVYDRLELEKLWLRHSLGMCYVIEPVGTSQNQKAHLLR
ncbi:C39 family peptidase [Deinococcus cellulosilyticus]|uniref:Peptidase C39-like domain-containing protein n=1 Tax=Deinococcus cellulosilyticus (strain DSM 18568 / NBRC 106333 / KACC 11606 / 5516J-15) TaxID=1223518 RepID=A0A511MY65_DEIC1|nr:C39 family peptidase [Deinococcus cellulosilyticus]GEM45530.1 hypothetical protein DC3_11650 [Deinococcus cellulosilyticus NBRC 106333 = KACC 11606]